VRYAIALLLAENEESRPVMSKALVLIAQRPVAMAALLSSAYGRKASDTTVFDRADSSDAWVCLTAKFVYHRAYRNRTCGRALRRRAADMEVPPCGR
jgi:hypothetical protein